MKPKETWIVILDQSGAKILAHRGNEKRFSVLDGYEFSAGLKTELGDHPGRSFASSSHRRHTYEQDESPDTEVISEVLNVLDNGMKGSKFDRFIVCAPPKILGLMRSMMPKNLSECLYGELTKNLSNTPIGDLPAHFEELLPV